MSELEPEMQTYESCPIEVEPAALELKTRSHRWQDASKSLLSGFAIRLGLRGQVATAEDSVDVAQALEISHRDLARCSPATMVHENTREIALRFCRNISDEWFDYLATLPHLNSLHLEGCRIGNGGAEKLSRLTKLSALTTSLAGMTSSGAEALSTLTNLTTLDVSGNFIGPRGAKAISKLKNLQHLHIGRNRIGPLGVDALSALTQLSSLVVCYNNIDLNGAETLTKLMNLAMLDVRSNDLGIGGAKALAKLTNLTELDVSATFIAGRPGIRHPSELASLPNLTALAAQYNGFSKEVKRELLRLPIRVVL